MSSRSKKMGPMSFSRSASVFEEGREGCANQAPTICCMPWWMRSSINISPSSNSWAKRSRLLQQTVVDDPKPETLNEIHGLKRQLLFVRRAVWPLRDVMNNLSRSDCPFLQEATKLFFRDVYDHVVQIVDTIETLREMVSASLDIYLSSVSYRLNAVMRVLTVITTIFMPLSFIASIYGMNFEHMPELKSTWGYPIVLIAMTVVGLGMLVLFRNKRWL